MNKSTINVPSAGTRDQQSTTAENQHVSQPNANTNVVGSLFSQREIKFKVWDNELKTWIWNLGMKSNNVVVNGKEKGRFNVVQYTGLKDKNGKEIYEGDILKSNYSLPLIVVFEDGKFCFYNSHPSGSDVLSQMRVEKLDVIGNIFENPELLETLR